jgi:hypothetical protein
MDMEGSMILSMFEKKASFSVIQYTLPSTDIIIMNVLLSG